NPNARFIGDEANHVQEESVATQTAHDQDDPNPTPGTSKQQGPKDRTGDSERTKIAESEEHKGEKDKAPGEKGTEVDVQHDNKPIEKPMAAQPTTAPPAENIPKSGGDGRSPSQVTQNPTPQLAPGTPPSPSPEVQQSTAPQGWSFNPIKPGAQATPDPVPG